MKSKRIWSLMLSLALFLGLMIPVQAAKADDLERMVQIVKSKVDIPEELEHFDYTYDTANGYTLWYMNWYSDNGTSVDVQIDSLGNLNQYSYYSGENQSGLARYNRGEGKTAAEQFLERAVPEFYPQFEEINATQNSTNTYAHAYTYQLYQDSIAVPSIQVNVYVDKYEGNVFSFYGLSAGDTVPNNYIGGNDLDENAIQKAYLEQLGLSLCYYSVLDFHSRNIYVFPAYCATDTNKEAIDAQSGELLSLWRNETVSFANSSADTAGSGRAISTTLTPAEQAAVDKLSGFISQQDAEKLIREQFSAIGAEMELNQVSLQMDYYENDKYYYDFYFSNAYASISAKDGSIIAYSLYETSEADGTALSYADALSAAKAFIEQYASDKAQQLSLSSTSTEEAYVNAYNYYSFQFYRQVNGVDFVDNGITITIDKSTGDVTDYRLTWYDNVSFPSLSGIISEERAFETVNAYGTLRLAYARTSPDTAKLAYQFANSVSFLINPYTGERITYDNKPYQENTLPEYSDLYGHWSATTVNELKENGYYLDGERFMPDAEITQFEFFSYLYTQRYFATDVEEMYEYLILMEIIKQGEWAPNEPLKRQDAAKYVVRALGLDMAASHGEIYNNPYSDNISEEYLGYATVCKALGIMNGNQSNAFNGDSTMTRAEAAMVIYGYAERQ